jgi:hypothetical protein
MKPLTDLADVEMERTRDEEPFRRPRQYRPQWLAGAFTGGFSQRTLTMIIFVQCIIIALFFTNNLSPNLGILEKKEPGRYYKDQVYCEYHSTIGDGSEKVG